jgi:hypothetical protein
MGSRTMHKDYLWQKKQNIAYWAGLFKEITELWQHWWEQDWIFIYPEDLFFTATDWCYFNIFDIHSSTLGLQLLNLALLKAKLNV